jgi:uncharacterized phiE125 gp8 family phage protein
MVSFKLIVQPVLEPVSLDEAKAWLKLDSADDDSVVTRLIASARQMVERTTRRALLTQTWRLNYSQAALQPTLVLPMAPASQIVSAFLQSVSGVPVPLELTGVWLDAGSEPPRLIFPNPLPASLSLACASGSTSVSFDIVFGYGDQPSMVPEALKQAVLVFVAQAYEQRCAVDVLPVEHIAGLIAPYIIRRI